MLCTVVVNMNIKAQTITEMPNSFKVTGNFLATMPTIGPVAAPTAAQTKTMVNASTVYLNDMDSTGRIYDPGGPSGNYLSNLTASATIMSFYSSTSQGIELTIESISLGTGDSLIIADGTNGSAKRLLAVGNGYTTTGKWILNSNDAYITFKSNADGNNGSGFSLLFRRLFNDISQLPAVPGFSGRSLFFDAKTGSLRSGLISNGAVIGHYSVATGMNTVASGDAATAMGGSTKASGEYALATGGYTTASGVVSTAMGAFSTASGDYSTALGSGSTASGDYSTAIGQSTSAIGGSSTAMGSNTSASGVASTAMGYNNYAAGNYSTAMGAENYAVGEYSTAMGFHTLAVGNNTTAIGSYVSTNGKTGAIAIGDNSTTTVMYSATSNSFRARFASGYRFYTSSDLTTNCLLAGGDNAWSTTSDRRTKENLAETEGEDFLKKIAGMQLTSWNYKSQNAKVRHYGPMAQDFFAAFGKDKYGTIGTDTTINSADFDGINLIAIQALEKRTTQMKNEEQESVKALQKQIEEMRALLLQQGKEIEDLKKMKDPCNSIVSIK